MVVQRAIGYLLETKANSCIIVSWQTLNWLHYCFYLTLLMMTAGGRSEFTGLQNLYHKTRVRDLLILDRSLSSIMMLVNAGAAAAETGFDVLTFSCE